MIQIEREYKFLATHGFEAAACSQKRILQAYLATTSSESLTTVRVRIVDDSAFLTIKGAPTQEDYHSRPEYEYPIPLEDAQEMLSLAVYPPIIKTRYYVPWQGLTIEVDCFEGANAGLITAEIELEADAELPKDLPSWIGKEVSDDARYFNSSLVKHPYTSWENRDTI